MNLIRRIKGWIFGNTFGDGADYASRIPIEDAEELVRVAKKNGQYGEFERGMEYYINHRRKYPRGEP